jgi:lysophospholipase L1-like esterase
MWLVYVVLAMAAGAVLAELAARLWVRRFEKYYALLPGRRTKIHFDTTFFRPLKSPIWRVVNRCGERGDAVPNSPGLYRVLLLGGSAAACGLLDQDRTWSAALQTLLNERQALEGLGARRVHVGCVAKSLVDTGGLRRILERILPQYGRVNLLVVMIGIADVLRWLDQGAPDGVAATPLGESECFAASPGASFGWKPQRTALASLWRRTRAVWLHHTEVLEDAGRNIRREAATRAGIGQFTPLHQDASGVMRLARENLRELLRVARRHADRVLVVQPPRWQDPESAGAEPLLWQGRIGRPEDGPPRFLSTADLYRLFGMLGTAVAEAAAEGGLEELNAQDRLNAIERPFYDHIHFTEAGARAMAQAVAAAVLGWPEARDENSCPDREAGCRGRRD